MESGPNHSDLPISFSDETPQDAGPPRKTHGCESDDNREKVPHAGLLGWPMLPPNDTPNRPPHESIPCHEWRSDCENKQACAVTVKPFRTCPPGMRPFGDTPEKGACTVERTGHTRMPATWTGTRGNGALQNTLTVNHIDQKPKLLYQNSLFVKIVQSNSSFKSLCKYPLN